MTITERIINYKEAEKKEIIKNEEYSLKKESLKKTFDPYICNIYEKTIYKINEIFKNIDYEKDISSIKHTNTHEYVIELNKDVLEIISNNIFFSVNQNHIIVNYEKTRIINFLNGIHTIFSNWINAFDEFIDSGNNDELIEKMIRSETYTFCKRRFHPVDEFFMDIYFINMYKDKNIIIPHFNSHNEMIISSFDFN